MGRITAAMKRNRRLETAVYCVLCALALILFFSGLSGTGPGVTAGGKSDTEKRLIRVLSNIAGAGDVDVMITYGNIKGEEQDICGVIVIAQGAKDTAVRVNLVRAVQTVLGVSREKVEIFTMGESG